MVFSSGTASAPAVNPPASQSADAQPVAQSANAHASDVEQARELHARYRALCQQLAGVIVGMDDVVEQLLIAILCRGHCILEGVPGLAKTLLVSTVGSLLGLSFRRIQFTPDLMPSDITGTDVLEEDRATGRRVFRFIKGPLFAHVILADEINRTPPKTQSALLEAMQERQVTVGDQSWPLPRPFFVLATQNPIEQEGTYPLPEAQLDRFMMKIRVGYPSLREEIEIAKRVTTDYDYDAQPVLDAAAIEQMQQIVRKVPVADHVYEFAVRLTRLTRPAGAGVPGERVGGSHAGERHNAIANEMINWGAGPRASICLLLAAKARALLRGRFHATTEDVAALALPVLRHRIVPTFNAEAAGRSTDDIVRDLLRHVPQQ